MNETALPKKGDERSLVPLFLGSIQVNILRSKPIGLDFLDILLMCWLVNNNIILVNQTKFHYIHDYKKLRHCAVALEIRAV